MANSNQGATCAPLFVTQQRRLRDFLADQDRLATIKADWLYRLVGTEARARILRGHGFTPVARLPSRHEATRAAAA